MDFRGCIRLICELQETIFVPPSLVHHKSRFSRWQVRTQKARCVQGGNDPGNGIKVFDTSGLVYDRQKKNSCKSIFCEIVFALPACKEIARNASPILILAESASSHVGFPEWFQRCDSKDAIQEFDE